MPDIIMFDNNQLRCVVWHSENDWNIMIKFVLIVTGYNCQKNVPKCIESIERQTYQNFQAIIVSDGSTDGTASVIQKCIQGKQPKFIGLASSANHGAAFHRYDAIHHYATDPEDVVVLVGLDDALKPNALERIKKEYDSGKWMSYGNWVNQFGIGLPSSFKLNFDEETHASRNYRKVKYRSTAVNTFKKFLFDQLDKSEFKFNGEWIKATTESNLMFSCLEMCGKERIGVIKDQIYLYNQGRKDNARKRMGDKYQDSIYNNVINLPKKPLLWR